MRLCIATPLYPPELGGPATYVRILEEELPKYGIDVDVVKFSDVRGKPKLIRHLAYFFAVRKAAHTADSILALDPISTGLPVALAARSLGKPFIVKIVGDYAWEQGTQRFGITTTLDEFVRTKKVPFPVWILRTIETWVTRGARTVIVPSEYLKAVVNAWGIPPAKISVVYNAMSETKVGTVTEAVSALSRPHIATIARLVPHKGIRAVIDAVVMLRASLPDASLVVVGDGPDRALLEAYAAQVLPGGIFFTGALSHEDTLAVLSDANLFVLNSTYEGLSHLLIEALTLGTPTIATDVGGNPELIQSGENGVLVPSGDTGALAAACLELLRDDARRAELSAQAKNSMKRFSPEVMLDGTYSVISSVS